MSRFSLIVLLLAASCGSTGKATDKHKPAAELATDKQAVITAFRAGGEEWGAMREEIRDQPVLANFVVDNMIDQMIRSYKRAQVTHTGKSNGPFELAQSELLELREYSTPVLADLLEVSARDAVVGFLAADTLRRIGFESAPQLLPKLDVDEAETRRRVLVLFAGMDFVVEPPSTASEALVNRVIEMAHADPEWIVRGEAATTLGAIGARMQKRKRIRDALTQCLLDEDTDVRCSAELAFGTLGDPRSFPVLMEVLGREIDLGSPRNMAAARRSLIDLSQDPSLEQQGRGFSIRDWQAYWKEHRDRLLRAPNEPTRP